MQLAGPTADGLYPDLFPDAAIRRIVAPDRTFQPQPRRPVDEAVETRPILAYSGLRLVGWSSQHDTQLWLFFEPRLSSSATVSGIGETRCTGPLAMSAVVWPRRLTAVTSPPCSTR